MGKYRTLDENLWGLKGLLKVQFRAVILPERIQHIGLDTSIEIYIDHGHASLHVVSNCIQQSRVFVFKDLVFNSSGIKSDKLLYVNRTVVAYCS